MSENSEKFPLESSWICCNILKRFVLSKQVQAKAVNPHSGESGTGGVFGVFAWKITIKTIVFFSSITGCKSCPALDDWAILIADLNTDIRLHLWIFYAPNQSTNNTTRTYIVLHLHVVSIALTDSDAVEVLSEGTTQPNWGSPMRSESGFSKTWCVLVYCFFLSSFQGFLGGFLQPMQGQQGVYRYYILLCINCY